MLYAFGNRNVCGESCRENLVQNHGAIKIVCVERFDVNRWHRNRTTPVPRSFDHMVCGLWCRQQHFCSFFRVLSCRLIAYSVADSCHNRCPLCMVFGRSMVSFESLGHSVEGLHCKRSENNYEREKCARPCDAN